MSLRSFLFGYRWSLEFYCGQRDLRYCLLGDSVVRLAGTVMHHYKDGAKPRDPWFLWMKFNRDNKGFLLAPWHFAADGENLTAEFLGTISSIDPGFRVQGEEPICIEYGSNRRIPLHSKSVNNALRGRFDPEDIYRSIGDETFFSILRQMFQK